jgi:hypothetical protein
MIQMTLLACSTPQGGAVKSDVGVSGDHLAARSLFSKRCTNPAAAGRAVAALRHTDAGYCD